MTFEIGSLIDLLSKGINNNEISCFFAFTSRIVDFLLGFRPMIFSRDAYLSDLSSKKITNDKNSWFSVNTKRIVSVFSIL